MTADVLSELIAGIRSDLDVICSTPTLADVEVERDVRLAAESLDDAACHMRRLRHQRLRSLFDGDVSGRKARAEQ